MDPAALRYVLVVDWAAMENTPAHEHKPLKLQGWRVRAHRLAEIEGRPVSAVIEDLRENARCLAARQREKTFTELARDLAVSRALGEDLAPPWQRRLHRLGEVMEVPDQTVRERVERLASRVEVVVRA